MKKTALALILLVAATAGASDLTARQQWQMLIGFDVAGPMHWTNEGLRPGDTTAAKLIVPCGTRLEWGFPVRVMEPVTWVTNTGTETLVQTRMMPEYTSAGSVTFAVPGTYMLRQQVENSTILYVKTTCEP